MGLSFSLGPPCSRSTSTMLSARPMQRLPSPRPIPSPSPPISIPMPSKNQVGPCSSSLVSHSPSFTGRGSVAAFALTLPASHLVLLIARTLAQPLPRHLGTQTRPPPRPQALPQPPHSPSPPALVQLDQRNPLFAAELTQFDDASHAPRAPSSTTTTTQGSRL